MKLDEFLYDKILFYSSPKNIVELGMLGTYTCVRDYMMKLRNKSEEDILIDVLNMCVENKKLALYNKNTMVVNIDICDGRILAYEEIINKIMNYNKDDIQGE